MYVVNMLSICVYCQYVVYMCMLSIGCLYAYVVFIDHNLQKVWQENKKADILRSYKIFCSKGGKSQTVDAADI